MAAFRLLPHLYVACCIVGAAADPLGKAGDSSSPHPVHVFTPTKEFCFRIPAVIRTAKGSLLAFAEARRGGCSDHLAQEVAVSRSTDQGKTWTAFAFAAGNASHHIGNPYPIALSSGRVVLVYHRTFDSASPAHGKGNGLVFSDDDGVTWSEERDISAGFGKAQGSSPGPGAGVQLASGRLLVVSHHGAYQKDYISYSDDGGDSWTTVDHPFLGMDEATLADLGGGEVLLNMRHTKENTLGRAIARSHDGGLTWGHISYDRVLLGPVCQGSLAVVGGDMYFSNPAEPHARANLTVRRSADGGRTWPTSWLIQAAVSAGYSSLVQGTVGDAGHGGILYEAHSHGSIDFAVFPLNMKPEVEEALFV